MSINFFDFFGTIPKVEVKGTNNSQNKHVEKLTPKNEIENVPVSKKNPKGTSKPNVKKVDVPVSKTPVTGKEGSRFKFPEMERLKKESCKDDEKAIIVPKTEKAEEISDNPKIEGKEEISEKNENASVKEASEPAKKPERKIVTISKMGNDHTFANKNNHDFAFNMLNMKIVMDGCGSGNHSEIGPRIFAQLFARKAKELYKNGETINEENFIDIVNSIFEKMLKVCNDSNFIFQNYCFTILVCFETDDEFIVYSCGDGFIIKEDLEGISFEELDDGEYPAYYVYNFIEDKESLVEYKDGVEFKVSRYSKDEYLNVGVATDGLRFLTNLMDLEKNKMNNFLIKGIKPQIEKLINRNIIKFHDDISICF